MSKEYEYRFVDINPNKIKQILKENGGKVYQKRCKMIVYHYKHPNYPNYNIRVRNEGKDKTLTIKVNNKSKFPEEFQINIDNIDNANRIVKLLGGELDFHNEKIREFWHIKGAKEIVFDELPGIPVFLEVDCHSMKDLINMCKLLQLDPENDFGERDKYNYYYGITSKSKESFKNTKEPLTFENASRVLGKLITKNKELFMKILEEQNDRLINI